MYEITLASALLCDLLDEILPERGKLRWMHAVRVWSLIKYAAVERRL
jgi:hypothetical protein